MGQRARAAWRIRSFRWLTLILIATCCASSACSTFPAQEAKTPPGAPTGLPDEASPALVFLDQGVTMESFKVQGSFQPSEGSSISPDGKYILGTFSDAATRSVVAYPLRPGFKPVEFYRMSASQSGSSALVPSGWTSANDCIFLVDEAETPLAGVGVREKPGTVVYTGSISGGDGSSRVVSLIPAMHPTAWLLPEQSEVYLYFRTINHEKASDAGDYLAFWKVDLQSGTARLLKDKLPDYGERPRPTLAPGGKYFVYQWREPGRSGIFVLDTASREERALLPDGPTKSFLPAFSPAVSPDGRFLAAYVAGQVKDERSGRVGYDVHPDVDGVWSAAHMLRVVDMTGCEVAAVDMKDKVITDIQWSADSRALSFQVGSMTTEQSSAYVFTAESIWMLNWPVLGTDFPLAPVQVATVPDEDKWASWIEQHPTADGVGVVWAVSGGDLRLSAPGAFTVTIRQDTLAQWYDGWWQVSPDMLGGFAVDWFADSGRQRFDELWLLGSAYCRRFASYGGADEFQADIVGVCKDTIVVLRQPDPAQASCYLDVFTFAPEYLDQKAWAAKSPWDRVKMAVGRVLNVEGYVAGSKDMPDSVDCRYVDSSHYLVTFRGAQDRYVWVDTYGNTAQLVTGAASKPKLEGFRGCEAWFVCSVKADNWTVFPYYLVVSPHTPDVREEPWFKEPGGDHFTVSLPGASYRVDDLTVTENRINMLLSVTGPAPGAPRLAGGLRPPRTLISEEGTLVTFAMQDVAMPGDMKVRMESFASPYAALKTISLSDGNVEIIFSVTGTYSFNTPYHAPEESNGQQVTCTILFDRPLPRDPRSPD